MAIRPKMVQVAARVGDGLSISVGASLDYIRDVVADVERDLAEAGRDRSAFRITALAMTAIGDDLDQMRAPIGPMLSTFPQASAAFLARGVVDTEELVRIEREEGPFGVMKYWTPERVDQIAFVSTPDRSQGQARRVRRHRHRRAGADDDQPAGPAACDRRAARRSATLTSDEDAGPGAAQRLRRGEQGRRPPFLEAAHGSR